ncbi:MAG: adenosylmethionine--8-amino-7-oxononanoate transaminase [Candidatus Omnitrophota bacterium]
MDKTIVIRNFSKSARDYDKHAKIQKKCAEKLVEYRAGRKKIESILEIGCGTGVYTGILREKYKQADITAIDISKDMIKNARKKNSKNNIQFIVMDGEEIDLPGKFDLITSNASFQWFSNFDNVLESFSKLLSDKGGLSFSTYGPDTFKELKKVIEIYRGRVQAISSSRFLPLDVLESSLKKRFKNVEIKKECFSASFSSLWEFLRDIKKSGARGEGLVGGVFLGKTAIKEMGEIYIKKFGKIRATHQIYFCRAWNPAHPSSNRPVSLPGLLLDGCAKEGKSIFVTGTDTGVGKTVVTGLLGRFFVEKGLNVITQKWIQTGCKDFSEDVYTHLRLMGKKRRDIKNYLEDVSPYALKFPASPHLSALSENARIESEKIEKSFQNLTRAFDYVLVEGAGGALVPLNEETLIIDIVKKLHLPVLIVAENKLGAINHTLLTIEALKKRNIQIIGIIFNRISNRENEIILKDNLKIVEKISKIKVLGELFYSEENEDLYGEFKLIGEEVSKNRDSDLFFFPSLNEKNRSLSLFLPSLIQKDLKYIWHPYTQMKDCEFSPPIPIAKAEGIKLYDYDGKFYYDTISSWWCNVHGHNHPVIKAAIKEQLDRFEHVLFAGFTHKPAIDLAEKLVSITPKNLTKVFYSDNGSTAVEAAMKMSFQYWQNTGVLNKTAFLSLDRAYHGDTIGAMSVSGVDLFNKTFSPLFFKSYKTPSPHCYRCPEGKEKNKCSLECLDRCEVILKENAKNIAAIIIEPLLMGAGGMIVYPAEYLKGISELARKYGTHLIVDEVATGFGRTGKMFACEHADIDPDFMCLSKGITSGYLPLGATLTSEEIFNAFCEDYEKLKTFYHGHTFTANPLAASAAIASIGLFEQEKSLKRVSAINERIKSFLREISDLPIVGDVRDIGVVGAVELVKNKKTKEPFGLEERMGYKIYQKGLKNNLILRPLGNVIYFFLPLCVSDNELREIFSISKSCFLL